MKVDGHLACGHQEAACRLHQDNQGMALVPAPHPLSRGVGEDVAS